MSDAFTMPLPAISRMQLLLLRSLVDRAVLANREKTDVGSMTALLLLDLAVESLVKQVITTKNGKVKGTESLSDLVSQLKALLPALRESSMGIPRRLRDARNPIQHSGQVPSSNAVDMHLEDAAAFMNEVVKLVFDVDFRKVSAANLMRSADVRYGLSQALECLGAERVDDAALWVGATFEVIRVRWDRLARRALGGPTQREEYLPHRVHMHVAATFGQIPEAVEVIHSEADWRPELSLLSMGFSLHELARLQAVTKHAVVHATGSAPTSNEADSPPGLRTEVPSNPELLEVMDILARQVWRLEVEHPELLPNSNTSTERHQRP